MTTKTPKTFAILAVLALAAVTACSESDNPASPLQPERNADQVSIDQGVWGDVWFWQGDFMPGTPTGTVTPVAREIVIHELTAQADVTMDRDDPRFIAEIGTREVARATSGADGFFQVALPPGRYSVFAVEGDGYYANLWDGEGNILPVTVVSEQVADVLVNIDYLSTW